MSQTNYQVNFDKAFEGMLGDANHMDALSRVIEGANVLFGKAVTFGTNDNQCKALSAISEKVAGIVIHKHIEEGELLEKDAVSLLRKGRIYVKVEEAVSPGDAVFVRAVVAGAEEAGSFRASADSTDCIDISSKAEYLTSAEAGEFALVDINLV